MGGGGGAHEQHRRYVRNEKGRGRDSHKDEQTLRERGRPTKTSIKTQREKNKGSDEHKTKKGPTKRSKRKEKEERR